MLFFSLEMSRVELTQRLLSSEARVDSVKMRNGRLTDDDWRRISHAIGRLGEAPFWIDDNPQRHGHGDPRQGPSAAEQGRDASA